MTSRKIAARMIKLSSAMILLLAVVVSVFAQEDGKLYPGVLLPNTELRTLHSNIAAIDYKLYVNLPNSYQDSSKAYPVVYMLDADYSFALAKNITEHLSDRNHLSELLLVAIAYDGPPNYRLNRTRDYTPTYSLVGGYGPEYQKHSGGGEKFREFIRTELMPFIDANYRTTKERTFVGHSYGGLFGCWVAFTTPELFNNYILVSPSLWYDDKLMFRLEEKFAATHRDLPIKLFLSIGSREINRDVNMVDDLKKFSAQVKARAYRGVSLQTVIFDDETHNSVFPFSLTRGLRMVYGMGSWMEAD